MNLYRTTKVIWRKGLEVPVGTEIVLTDKEVKYLRHAVVLATPEKADAIVEDVAEEATEEKPHRRRHKAEANDGDSH